MAARQPGRRYSAIVRTEKGRENVTHMSTKVNFVSIPQELKRSASFCLWKLGRRNGKLTKIPYDPKTGGPARTNEPDTFSDFGTAMKAYAMGGYDGIGFRVSEGIGAIDIDHCIREDGGLNDVAASILGMFGDDYFERSPSGTGLRGFFQLDPSFAYDRTAYYINNRKYGLEVYLPGTTNRFVTVTGDVYRAGNVVRDDAALQSCLDTFMKRPSRAANSTVADPCSYLTDEQVIRHASSSASGEKFKALYEGRWEGLYDSQSDADMALVSMLAFWCGCVEEQIDRVFRTSGLMRDKWDRKTGDSTYGQITIRNAVSSCSSVYLPVRGTGAENPEDEFDVIRGQDGPEFPGGDAGCPNDADGAAGPAQGASFRPARSFLKLTLEQMRPHTNPRYGMGEIGIGNIFADYYRPIARYNRERGIWYVYDGSVWRPDNGDLAVMEMAKSLADGLLAFALQIGDEDTRSRYIKRVQKLQVRKNRRTMVEDAKSVFPVDHSVFDRDARLFNCRNGTLDLRTMEFREHRPADFITLMSGVTYDPDAVCPRWESFISEVMCGDADLAAYLQKALGYALTGDTFLECLFILYGATSRNGKGTTMETFLKIMGDYGKTSNPEMLSARFGASNTSGPSEDIARLAGVRFVNISEPEKRVTFNAALVKRMTGNDTLNARFLHENSFDFRPNFKIFINTNYLPNVSDMALFESGRLKIIPFRRHFNEREQDKGLKGFFAEDGNLSGIFNWCLEGYREFLAHGLDDAEAVTDATREYRKDSDRIGQFIEAWLEDGEGYEVRSSAAYKRYVDWCRENNYNAENVKNFKTAMQGKYAFERRRPKDGGDKTTLILGCRLREEELGTETDDAPALS